ncbi:unnamed protein product [Clonostachys chloroleuca]|uniref:Hemerythrin-like domain-containing protein n=1 Tax=Clonostachys chloroleuca TaxID=1926264 RepID=A0AA35LXV1_9HYPO|nr:unnamed protein product [Clonostachys chloroleuca]
MASAAEPSANKPPAATETEKLPPLSDHDFKQYNRMAVRMDAFHNYFRQSWTLLWDACNKKKRPQGMSMRQFIGEGLSFAEHLTMHHGIEERHFFPMLARRMPEFRGNLPDQHKEIHAGLEVFEAYLRGCLSGEHELELPVLKEKMETWGDVLWAHLDDEVKTLGAENMRKYWTLEEMRRMPM